MGLFNKKSKPPVAVGSAVCCVHRSGAAYVGQQYHEAITPEAISALAPITWALFACGGFSSRSLGADKQWLDSVLEFGSGESLTHEVNYGGVSPFEEADRSLEMDAVIVGSFYLTSDSKLTGSWTPKGPFDADVHPLPLLGGLLAAAEWCGQEREVWHALVALAGVDIDFSNPAVFAELPQMLLDYGAEQANLDDMKGGFQ